MEDLTVRCPICKNKISGEQYYPCDYCGWVYTECEQLYDEDERDDYNLISKKEAKENLSKGLDIWGEPIKKQ